MKELLEKLKAYEKKNNTEVHVKLHSDGSGVLINTYEEKELFEFDTEIEFDNKIIL